MFSFSSFKISGLILCPYHIGHLEPLNFQRFFSVLHSHLSCCKTPIMCNLAHLVVSHKSVSLQSFLPYFFVLVVLSIFKCSPHWIFWTDLFSHLLVVTSACSNMLLNTSRQYLISVVLFSSTFSFGYPFIIAIFKLIFLFDGLSFLWYSSVLCP